MIETSVRSARKGVAVVTGAEQFAIFGAINEALIDIGLEPGIDVPKAIMSDTTAATTADTNYVDLDAAIVNVVDGTVRIVAEDTILERISLAEFYAIDPGEDTASTYPTAYALDTDGAGAIRLRLRTIPDAAYTINMNVETLPDEDTVGDLPDWYHPALRSLATALSLEILSLDPRFHQARYDKRIAAIRDKNRGFSGPMHLPLRTRAVRQVASELRATI
jgi:hypothetical protein